MKAAAAKAAPAWNVASGPIRSQSTPSDHARNQRRHPEDQAEQAESRAP